MSAPRPGRWYVVIAGDRTFPVRARSERAARRAVLVKLNAAGHVSPDSIRARRADRADAGWMRAIGAHDVAHELEQQFAEVLTPQRAGLAVDPESAPTSSALGVGEVPASTAPFLPFPTR